MYEVRYAGFWVRFFASFLDTLFLALPVGVVIYFLSDGNWFDFSQFQQNLSYAMSGNAGAALANQPPKSLKWEIFFEVLVLLITAIFWRKFQGATPGKKILHIKIVDAKTFKEVDTRQVFTRSLGYFASIITFLVGFLMIAFREDKRGLHDLLAGTAVIYDDTIEQNS